MRQGIFGDPGTVSRVGRKDATKVFKQGRKSPWVPTLTKPFSNGQAYWAQKCFVLLCPIAKQHLLSSFRAFVHDYYCLAILVWLVHQINTRSQETFSLTLTQSRNSKILLSTRKLKHVNECKGILTDAFPKIQN